MANAFIKVRATGKVVEVNRNTATEMVASGHAEYADAPKAEAKKEVTK